MKKYFIYFSLFLAMILPPLSGMGGEQKNAFDSGAAFTDPQSGEGTQVVLGLGDLLGAGLLAKSSRNVTDLRYAQFQREIAAQAKKVSELNRRTHFSFANPFGYDGTDAGILDAESKKLATMRDDFTKFMMAKPESKASKAIRYTKVVGSALLLVDAAGRIYVWNALDKDPTLTPVGEYLLKKTAGGKDIDIVKGTTPPGEDEAPVKEPDVVAPAQ